MYKINVEFMKISEIGLEILPNVMFGPKMSQIGIEGCQGTAEGSPSATKIGPRRPKVAPRMAKRWPLEAIVVPKGPPGKHFGSRI